MSRRRAFRILGVAGTVICAGIFLYQPSFPTPDKLLIFGTFLGMAFSQAIETLKRFAPFVGILLVYESFRGVADNLNKHVDFTILPDIDKFMFSGNLPTVWLQERLWNGQVRWYDFALYIPYMLHFVLPLIMALLVWKFYDKQYWRVITTYVTVSFAGFLTFLAFPAAPPWMASDLGRIEPIHRISSDVWFALGVHDFPSVYDKIAPNAVAAMPSLHAAYSTLFAIFAITIFRSRWRWLSLIYPAMIYFGTVYMGEHYLIDELVGSLYAAGAFFAAPYVLRPTQHVLKKFWKQLHHHKRKLAPRTRK